MIVLLFNPVIGVLKCFFYAYLQWFNKPVFGLYKCVSYNQTTNVFLHEKVTRLNGDKIESYNVVSLYNENRIGR